MLTGQRCKRDFLPLKEGTRQEWSFLAVARAIRQERKMERIE